MTSDSNMSDAQLVAQTAEKVARPRRDPADSFVLHAPLELTARASLLPFVAAKGRAAARERIAAVGDRFEQAGPAAELPTADAGAFDHPPAAAEALVAAVAAGDVDAVDAPAAWLGEHAAPAELTALLGAEVLPRLGAAAHAPIFLFALPRVAPRGEVTGRLLRPLVRELARMPESRLHWIDERETHESVPASELGDALGAMRSRGRPEVDFIAPTMQRIDDSETADLFGPLVGGDHVGERGRAVLRCAARSMLVESTEFTPYIWTHCLTLPQAALGCASALEDPSLALAVAVSHVAGFRSAFGTQAVHDPLPEAIGGSLGKAIDTGPDEAAAVAIGLGLADRSAAITTLATKASEHTDAHYVKYTLACLDAAADDPASADLYVAAAAKLAGYWAQLDRM